MVPNDATPTFGAPSYKPIMTRYTKERKESIKDLFRSQINIDWVISNWVINSKIHKISITYMSIKYSINYTKL